MSDASRTPPVVHRSRKRRFARWLLVTLVGSFLLVTLWNLIGRGLTRVASKRELAAAIAETDRDDPDWRWDRLNATRQKLPDGKNSAELIPQIKNLVHAEWGTTLANEEWRSRLEVPPNVRYTPAVIGQVRRDLTDSAAAIVLARTLKDYPFGHREIVLKPNVYDTLLTDTANTRHIADLLRWDAVIAVEEGDTTHAMNDVFALLNTSRSIGDEPFLISQVIRMAVRMIAIRHAERVLAHVAAPLRLAELQAALAADAEEPLLLYGLRGERAVLDQLFENVEAGDIRPEDALSGGPTTNPWERFGWWHYRGHLPADHAYTLRWMTVCVDYARLPVHEQPAAFATVPIPLKDPKRILSSVYLPAADKVSAAHWRATAEARCAVVGIACERFRQEHQRWPETLDQLVPTFVTAVPLDPFDGQPVRYTKSNDGIVVYSVGKQPPPQNGLPAVNRWLPGGIEIGFQLWNPDQRRLPPRPDPIEPEREPPP